MLIEPCCARAQCSACRVRLAMQSRTRAGGGTKFKLGELTLKWAARDEHNKPADGPRACT